MNCDDGIIALEMERITEEKEKAEKLKKKRTLRERETDEAKAVIEEKGKDYDPKASMNKNTKYVPNWTQADLKAMIKWKAPKRPNIPTNREGLEEVWEEVKDLVAPDNEPRWTQRDENILAEFQNNGRFTIERTYIMRRAERRKMDSLAKLLSNLHTRNALKVIGCGIQHLEESERQELFNNWKDYTLDDDYSQSTVSSIGELDLDENNGDENSSEDGQDIERYGNNVIEVIDSDEDSFLFEEEDHDANDQC